MFGNAVMQQLVVLFVRDSWEKIHRFVHLLPRQKESIKVVSCDSLQSQAIGIDLTPSYFTVTPRIHRPNDWTPSVHTHTSIYRSLHTTTFISLQYTHMCIHDIPHSCMDRHLHPYMSDNDRPREIHVWEFPFFCLWENSIAIQGNTCLCIVS